jgi:hypothetical protein
LGLSQAIERKETPVPQWFPRKFPKTNNREIIFSNREISSVNREICIAQEAEPRHPRLECFVADSLATKPRSRNAKVGHSKAATSDHDFAIKSFQGFRLRQSLEMS